MLEPKMKERYIKAIVPHVTAEQYTGIENIVKTLGDCAEPLLKLMEKGEPEKMLKVFGKFEDRLKDAHMMGAYVPDEFELTASILMNALEDIPEYRKKVEEILLK